MLKALVAGVSAVLLLAMVTMGATFSLSALSFSAWLVLIVLVLLVVPVQMSFEKVFDKCSALLEVHRRPGNQKKSKKRVR